MRGGEIDKRRDLKGNWKITIWMSLIGGIGRNSEKYEIENQKFQKIGYIDYEFWKVQDLEK